MRLKEIISHDYFKLFVKREGQIVLGKHYSNMWLLCCVLFATFLAIAFSNASLDYLSYKMKDPFINWVDIKNSAGYDITGFEESLQNEDIMAKYHFGNYQTDQSSYWSYSTYNASSCYLRGRFFEEIQTPLVQAILDKENVIEEYKIAYDQLNNDSYGIIITQDALVNKLGYKNEVPAYIYYRAYCDYEAADEFGADLVDGNCADVPLPVLGVVKRLPTNMDIIGTKHFYDQRNSYSLNMYEPSYFSSFIYYLPENVNSTKFIEFLEQVKQQHTDLSSYTGEIELPRMKSFGDGRFVYLAFDDEDEVDFMVNKTINEEIIQKYGSKGVIRIFDYINNETSYSDYDYISVHFQNLNEITAFQEFAKDEFHIDIEMSQINAKDNFNEVSIMANILSWTMIIFAIICILLFIINLLQSYFQKVKRNLGTFKAFGISNKDLISVYVLIMLVTICIATLIALIATLIIQGTLPLLGFVKDGVYNYLSLWSGKTLSAVIIIIAASGYTVYYVVSNLLKATPGDLIYDR